MEGFVVCVVEAFLAQKPGAYGGLGFGLSFALAHMRDGRGLLAHCVKVMDRLADGSLCRAKLDLGPTARLRHCSAARSQAQDMPNAPPPK